MITEAVVADDGAIHALDRVARDAPQAYERGLDKLALLTGRKISENVDKRVGSGSSGRLARSFLFNPAAPAPAQTRLLGGRDARWYASVQEYGQTITTKRKPYLVFQTADGEWHKATSVTIPEKRFARDALGEIEGTDQGSLILGLEIQQEFRGRA